MLISIGVFIILFVMVVGGGLGLSGTAVVAPASENIRWSPKKYRLPEDTAHRRRGY